MKKVSIFGLPLSYGTFDEAAQMVSRMCATNPPAPHIVAHINANNLSGLLKLPELSKYLSAESTLLMDGIGLKIAAFIMRRGWLPDLNGTDLFPNVMKSISERNISVFLLGGMPGIVEAAAVAIQRRWDATVVGWRDGYFDAEAEGEICAAINATGANVLLVGRGFPLQEQFARRNRHRLSVRVIWTVGGLFEFMADKRRRAPKALRWLRLEWLFRWVLEPRLKAYRTWIVHPGILGRAVRSRFAGETGSIEEAVEYNTLQPIMQSTPKISVTSSARIVATEMLARHFRAPPYLIIFVSDKCWMRCAHCWFSEDWKEAHHKRPLLTFDHYSRMADSSRLRFVSFTGGEAFRRDDVVELITMMRRKSGITRYQIPTSGFLPEMIVGKAEALLRANPGVPFRVDVSLDGTSETHDRIRAIRGGWAKAFETIQQLNALKRKYPYFDVGVITTVSHNNEQSMEETAQLVRSIHEGEWMINITRGQSRDPSARDISLANYKLASRLADRGLYEGKSKGHRGGVAGPLLTAKNAVRRRIIADTLEGKRAGGGCAAGSLGGVIYADGEVHACEMLDNKLGNLHDYSYDLSRIWMGSAAQDLRKHIQESRCQCTQECFLSVSMLIQPTAWAGMAGELAKRTAQSLTR